MKIFCYFAGTGLLLVSASVFYYLSKLPPLVHADFDVTGILFLITAGPRLLILILGIGLAIAGVVCFIVPRMAKFQPIMKP